jgi:hypothetical protein
MLFWVCFRVDTAPFLLCEKHRCTLTIEMIWPAIEELGQDGIDIVIADVLWPSFGQVLQQSRDHSLGRRRLSATAEAAPMQAPCVGLRAARELEGRTDCGPGFTRMAGPAVLAQSPARLWARVDECGRVTCSLDMENGFCGVTGDPAGLVLGAGRADSHRPAGRPRRCTAYLT